MGVTRVITAADIKACDIQTQTSLGSLPLFQAGSRRAEFGGKKRKKRGEAAGPSSRPESSRKPALRPTVPFGPEAYWYLTLLGPSHAHDLGKSWIRAPWSPATPREVSEPPTDPPT